MAPSYHLTHSLSLSLSLSLMESLSRCLSASPPFTHPSKTPPKSTPKSHPFLPNYIRICNCKLNPLNSDEAQTPNHQSTNFPPNISFLNSLKPQFSPPFLGLTLPIPCSAAETAALPTEEVPGRINLESILVSVDNFFNRYPFFVATVVFIWLVAIPVTEQLLQKYQLISAINAFKKLQNDPAAQLLDIREDKSVTYLGSPNLKLLGKKAVQVQFREGDEEGFVKRVLQNFGEPSNTTLCILDNFDGNSMKVAELLVKNGFKEAYAIRGGIRGKKGWEEIQEEFLPPSVHIYPKKKTKLPKQVNTNGGITRVDKNKDPSLHTGSPAAEPSKELKNGDFSPAGATVKSKEGQKPQSPYPNYPELKPPSSPTPSKPK